jgi:hypothetical protein
MSDSEDPPDEEKVEMFECPMCRRMVPPLETITMGGRRICFGCASGWYEDDEDEEKK